MLGIGYLEAGSSYRNWGCCKQETLTSEHWRSIYSCNDISSQSTSKGEEKILKIELMAAGMGFEGHIWFVGYWLGTSVIWNDYTMVEEMLAICTIRSYLFHFSNDVFILFFKYPLFISENLFKKEKREHFMFKHQIQCKYYLVD